MGGRVIVFKPGPVAGLVQGSCSRFWSGHPVARVNPYFLKNQNDVILVKKKKQKSTGCNWVFDRVLLGHRVTLSHDFSYFFCNPAWFQPQVSWIPSRPARPSRVSKRWAEYYDIIHTTKWCGEIIVSPHPNALWITTVICCNPRCSAFLFFFYFFFVFFHFFSNFPLFHFFSFQNYFPFFFQLSSVFLLFSKIIFVDFTF